MRRMGNDPIKPIMILKRIDKIAAEMLLPPHGWFRIKGYSLRIRTRQFVTELRCIFFTPDDRESLKIFIR